MKSYKGKILISTPDVSGDFFSRTVILLLEHNEEGAFGLILNKKSFFITNQLPELFGFDIQVFEGGPVENNRIFFIIKGKPVTEHFQEIDNEFYFTEDLESIINSILEGSLDIENIKVFSGYSGWSGGQLEREIKQKFWHIVDVYHIDYTAANDQNLWKNMMQNLGGEFLIWANAPQDVSLN